MTAKLKLKSLAKWITTSVWAFPAILFVVLVSLTILRVHGSSVGIYNSFLYGLEAKDPNLLYGSPKPIRSDEWRATTPLTALQVQANFPSFNETLSGSGRDVTFSQDAAVLDWVGIFRPQNWSFFVLPFEHAFAFRWWLMMFLLIVAAYFFILRVLKGKKLLAIVLSVSFALSPYLLWWYQQAGFLAFAFGLMIMIIGMRIINQEKIPKIKSKLATDLLYAAALAYLGICFAMLIYAPFLIPVGIIVTAFLVGYLLDKRGKKKLSLKHYARLLMPFAVALAIIASAIATYAIGHRDVLERFDNSVYPGQRVVESGKLAYSSLLPMFGGFLMPLLQSSDRAINYYANQSETSNFILLLPFLIIPGIFIQLNEYRKKRKINYAFLFLQIIAVLFWVRIALPVGDAFYNLLLLNRVPNSRLLAGLGFVGFLQLIYFIRVFGEYEIERRKLQFVAAAYGLVCLGVLLVFGLNIMDKYPLFLDKFAFLIGFAVLFTAIIVTFVMKRWLVGAALLFIFTAGSGFHILPIYRGMEFFTSSNIVKKIQAVSSPEDEWVVLDSLRLETLPWIAGRGTVSGPQSYTDLDFWAQIDKERKYVNVYNRQAHAMFLSNTLKPEKGGLFNLTSVEEPFELVKSNLFKVRFDCSEFTYNNIDYVLVEHAVKKDCLELVDRVVYPKIKFYIYKITPPGRP